MSVLESPMPGQVYQSVPTFDSYEAQDGRFATTNLDEAQVITSMVAGVSGKHKLIIDLDLSAQLIPSSTPGHFHLYVDHVIEHDAWVTLIDALADAGLIEDGYRGASLARGFTDVRLPWIKKQTNESEGVPA